MQILLVGNGCGIAVDKIVAIIGLINSSNAREHVANAKASSTYIDVTSNKKIRSYIYLSDGGVVACNQSAELLLKKLDEEDNYSRLRPLKKEKNKREVTPYVDQIHNYFEEEDEDPQKLPERKKKNKVNIIHPFSDDAE